MNDYGSMGQQGSIQLLKIFSCGGFLCVLAYESTPPGVDCTAESLSRVKQHCAVEHKKSITMLIVMLIEIGIFHFCFGLVCFYNYYYYYLFIN